jgi:hypothetical protein
VVEANALRNALHVRTDRTAESTVMSTAEIRWTYDPTDYFEAPYESSGPNYRLRIEGGQAVADVEPAGLAEDPEFRSHLNETVQSLFRVIEIARHVPFHLDDPTLVIQEEGGSRRVFLTKTGTVGLSGHLADSVVRDAQGNIISDTGADRRARQKHSLDLVARALPQSQRLAALLASYSGAVRDSQNELMHLYEIRDSLAIEFGNDRQARAALGISRPSWSRLGQLANDEPLRQGRHRGESAGALRSATQEELSEARAIAWQMIEAYANDVVSRLPP